MKFKACNIGSRHMFSVHVFDLGTNVLTVFQLGSYPSNFKDRPNVYCLCNAIVPIPIKLILILILILISHNYIPTLYND